MSENNKESKLLKDVIKEVFEHELLEKGRSKDRFDEVIKDKNIFLGIFSPWHQDKGEELIQGFVNNVKGDNSTNDFSWLDILDDDKRWKEFPDDKLKKEIKENKKKYTNMRYQIPSHFHGDIDNAVLFYCMENPRGYLGDYKDSYIDKEFQGETLNEFYLYSASIRNEKSKTLKEIIRERYQLEKSSIEKNLEKEIINIIYSHEESALGREIEHIYKQDKNNKYYNFDFESKESKTKLLKDYYYFKEYYSQLIQTDQNLDFKKLKNEKEAVKEIADKICNVEIYPFSCAQPNLGGNGIGGKILRNSDLSRLGAYIVLRRIYKYLQEVEKGKKDAQKPVIIFRKYDSAWKELFKKIFDEVKDFDNKLVLELLEKGFFYCQLAQQGGGITSGNVISVPNYKILLSMKKDAFKEISDLLPRIDIDKISVKESGNE
ncbi:hypothetical protein [uncultured Gemella sp.]|uniref:hypothetical protein n=1 Tax=uncultured Gemella sp. TaxID=254352 RepID=UPI0028D49ED0|nr:hypothetical protein [uncultured Gemella sp.]